jgi:broad specificity phosphatase PhoE
MPQLRLDQMAPRRTVIHLVRHGEVFNPAGVLYGRLPDYHLSDVGREMAERVARELGERDIVHLRCSPLERAQETMAPLAATLGLAVTIDDRVLEAENYLQGLKMSFPSTLTRPKNWRHFRNPLTPSWGEPYKAIVARMGAAMKDAHEAASGHEAVIVSHQLPIWMARCNAEGRRLIHDPRRRDCSLASVTSFSYLDGRIVSVAYREPAADQLREPAKKKSVAGA